MDAKQMRKLVMAETEVVLKRRGHKTKGPIGMSGWLRGNSWKLAIPTKTVRFHVQRILVLTDENTAA